MKEKLFHYCSIKTLELILKHQTIRFSSLSTVDDTEESNTAEDDYLGKICFVSCWTDLKEDTIEMWRGYTDVGKGVRIGLNKDFFKEGLDPIEPLEMYETIKKRYDISLSPPYMPELLPVTYTKDESLIKLSVLKNNSHRCNKCGKNTLSINYDTKLLGKFKRFNWLHQSEWRYKLTAVPYQLIRNNLEGKYLKSNFDEVQSIMEKDILKMQFDKEYIDYPISKDVFESIEVLTSPLNTKEDNYQIEEIIEKYLPNKINSIKESGLRIRK